MMPSQSTTSRRNQMTTFLGLMEHRLPYATLAHCAREAFRTHADDPQHANDNDAFILEIWAQEGLVILEENMVAANLVHRDFQNEIKDFGDVVNTRRPGTFKTKRKVDGTTLSQQDANATNVRVPLDQWFYNSFTIKDGEASKSFQELVDV
jgi:hypothetical protein